MKKAYLHVIQDNFLPLKCTVILAINLLPIIYKKVENWLLRQQKMTTKQKAEYGILNIPQDP